VGDLSTMTLVPQVADAVKIPVLAAGGIADGRGVAASLMLGASGVQCGTVFLCATECAVHETYKQKIIKAGDIDTVVTGKRLNHAVRSLKTPFTRRYMQKEFDPATSGDELEAMGSARCARPRWKATRKTDASWPDRRRRWYIACGGRGDHHADVYGSGNAACGSAEMGKIAFVFAGQGAQYAAWAKACTKPPRGQSDSRSGRGPAPRHAGNLLRRHEGELSRTENTQPCLMAVDCACAGADRGGRRAEGFAGFSLGEIAALWASGMLSFAEAFRLTLRRAELMAACAGAPKPA
jgi:hypothetical protein